VTTVKRALPCGDYGLVLDGTLVASVERKSLVDLVASLTGGKLRYTIAELAALPRAAVVVEDRYPQLFKLDRVRPAVVADGLAELHIRWPGIPRRVLRNPPTRRGMDLPLPRRRPGLGYHRTSCPATYLTRQHGRVHRPRWGTRRAGSQHRRDPHLGPRHWPIPDRGRLRPEIRQAWHDAHHTTRAEQ
jgi:ERCC4 domain